MAEEFEVDGHLLELGLETRIAQRQEQVSATIQRIKTWAIYYNRNKQPGSARQMPEKLMGQGEPEPYLVYMEQLATALEQEAEEIRDQIAQYRDALAEYKDTLLDLLTTLQQIHDALWQHSGRFVYIANDEGEADT